MNNIKEEKYIWVVSEEEEYYSTTIIGVFSSEEKALEKINAMDKWKECNDRRLLYKNVRSFYPKDSRIEFGHIRTTNYIHIQKVILDSNDDQSITGIRK